MKQVLQNLRTGRTSVVEVPIPTPQSGEILVRTSTSLVSAGTERMLVEFAEKNLVGKVRSRPDLARQVIEKGRREGWLTTIEAAFNRLDQPMPLGYSSAGTIVALGDGIQGLKTDQRVACAGGGYAVHAEYVCVPRNLVVPLPDEVDFETAAFATLGAIALHGFRLSETQLSERVAVIGLGLLGLLCVGIARAAGCSVLGIDLLSERVALGQRLGALSVMPVQAQEAANSFSRGRGCDAVLICADTPSDEPVELAGLIARDRARVVAVGAVGLQIPRKLYYEKELTFINSRSYGPGRYDPLYEEAGHDYPVGYIRWTEGRNLEAVVDLMASRQLQVEELITHHFPIDSAVEAYELITGKREEPFLGVLLTYPGEKEEQQAEVVLKPIPVPEQKFASLEASEDKNMGSVRVGVLGAGNFATSVMLPAMRRISNLNLVGVASASGVNARHAADKYHFQYSTSDERRILADPEVDVIAIFTRHNHHARQTQLALMNGKHVFCEKPLAINQQELENIVSTLTQIQASQQVETAHPPLLMVGFNRRFAPLALKLKSSLEGRSEPLMATYRVNAGFIPANHWLHDPIQGGGRIIGEGCHFIDFLCFLVGETPESVFVRGLPDSGRYREDNISMTFTFPDGSVGVVNYLANGDKAFPKERIEVISAGRVAVLDDFRSLELAASGRRHKIHSRLRQDKGHGEEWNAFVSAILVGGPPPIPYRHLIGVTQASLAALEALRSGKTVKITLEE